ncbi:MAG: putative pyrophosphatase [Candidatus Magasanikbacteria bacterium GW2011_GWA2_42_32]|uniref:Putative pyrophosphatase n=1 Tax=Candidatus Magasanikbacteria bacterium GW2011_GWA2_42_32 TaxID=1619039 RepID=A0A0G0ZZB4_9BACT|nr:MAG: putative pyrophosphatase [Candidatus Magasanikbacteria bacterium GW2011_GWA2_42_32]
MHPPYFQRPSCSRRHKNKGQNFIYPTLGLAGETGEVAEKVKKILRDKNGVVDEQTKESLKKELGDVLWYLSQLATEFDLSLDDIADTNLKKLLSRLERGKIGGDGDDR